MSVLYFTACDNAAIGGAALAVWFLSKNKDTKSVGAYLKYLEKQVRDSGAEIRMSTMATADTIKEEGFESVIVATGAKLNIPTYCEIGEGILAPLAILDGEIPEEDNIIVCGAGLVGCETDLYLTEHGKKVTMIDMAETAGPESAFYLRYSLWGALMEAHIDERLEHKILAMDKQSVTCEHKGEKVEINGEAVVCALGMKSDRALYESLAKELTHIDVRVFEQQIILQKERILLMGMVNTF